MTKAKLLKLIKAEEKHLLNLLGIKDSAYVKKYENELRNEWVMWLKFERLLTDEESFKNECEIFLKEE